MTGRSQLGRRAPTATTAGPRATTTSTVPGPTSAPQSQPTSAPVPFRWGYNQLQGTGGSMLSAAASAGPAPEAVLR